MSDSSTQLMRLAQRKRGAVALCAAFANSLSLLAVINRQPVMIVN